MGNRLRNVIIICLMVFSVLSLIGCSNMKKEVLMDKDAEQTIGVKLNNIFALAKKNISHPSNLDDYIKGLEHNQDYSYIISQGKNSLKYMLGRFAEDNSDGIEEYIMASACSKILKQNPYIRIWNTGREWYDNYMNFINNNPYATGEYEPITNPIYKSNKDKPLSTLLTKRQMLERIKKNHVKKERWKVVSIELKTYKEYKFEDVPHIYDFGYIIDPYRMVWVVVTIYPDGYQAKRGFVDNAAIISAFDSENGNILEFYIFDDKKIHSQYYGI